jgi:hypothetical protein
MAEAGIPRDHIAKVLNHVEGGPVATRVYDRYNYDAESATHSTAGREALLQSSREGRRRWSPSVHDGLGYGAATAKIDVRCR